MSTDSGSKYRPLDDFDHGILSPSGRISKRGRDAAIKRLADRLWPDGCTREDICGKDPEPTEEERLAAERGYLLAQAKRLRDLANLGMSRRKFNKEAERLEKLAAEIKV